MKRTKLAQRWLDIFGEWYTSKALAPIIERGEKIARERKSQFLGRVHLEKALEELVFEETAHIEAGQ